MKKKCLIISGLFLLLCSFLFTHLFQKNAFATGAVVPGGPASAGGTCSNYCTTHVAWLYHKWGEDLELSDVYESYGDHVISAYPGSAGGTSGATIPAECGKVGGYYRLAFYYYGGSGATLTSPYGITYVNGQQIGAAGFSALKTIAPSTFNFEAGNFGSSRPIYGWDEAKAAFAEMKQYDITHGTNYTNNHTWSETDNMTIFCFGSDTTDSTVTWDSYSKVSLSDANDVLKTESTSWNGEKTDIVYEFDSKNAVSATIKFDHYLRRNKAEPSDAFTNYKITEDGASNTVKKWSGTSTTGERLASDQTTISLSIGPEDSYTKCQTIFHDGSKTYDSDGKQTGSTIDPLKAKSRICITVKNIHRKETTVSWQTQSAVSLYDSRTGTTPIINGSGKSPWDGSEAITYTFDSGDTEAFYVQFNHSIKRNNTTQPAFAAYQIKSGDTLLKSGSWSGVTSSDPGATIFDGSGGKQSDANRILVQVAPQKDTTICQTALHDGSKTFYSNGTQVGSTTNPLGKTSSICITIKNTGSTKRYSSSTASVGSVSTESTGIKAEDSPSTATTKIVKLDIQGGPKTLTLNFQHNAYSASKTSSDIPIAVHRTLKTKVNGSTTNSNGFGSERYDISYPVSTTYSANGIDYAANSNFKTKFTTSSGLSSPKYIANNRPYKEVGGNSKFVHQDIYNVTFRSEGTFTFCESITVGDKEITGACIVVAVENKVTTCTDWLPESYTNSDLYEGTTTTVSGVKNVTLVGKDGAWAKSNGNSFDSKQVWAKPNDVIAWRHCYFPGVQKVAYTTATKNGRNYQMSNSVFGTWENKWNVSNANLKTSNKYGNSYTSGILTVREWKDTYTVETGTRSRAGLELTETSTSGIPRWAQVVNKVQSRTEKTATDVAMVKVPYNFKNSIEVEIGDKNKVAFAGESITIGSANITISQKYNDATKGTYATKVKDADVRLYAYTASSEGGAPIVGYSATSKDTDILCHAFSYTYGNCRELIQSTTDLNNPEKTDGATEEAFKSTTYNVYDVPAGEYYCVRAAVYPYTSGGDKNMDKEGDRTWYISAPSCKKIAKKPNMQVWGNSLFSTGSIVVNQSAKSNIYGIYGYAPRDKSKTTVFSSWVEQSIVSRSSKFSGLASGAATGNSGNFLQRTPAESQGIGGSKEGSNVKLCFRSPLTIPNYCNMTTVAPSSGAQNQPSDKSSLIAYFMEHASENSSFTYEELNGDKEISATEIPTGETRVIHVKGTATITNNITYANDSYSNLEQIPKLIIYAEKDIKIHCSVTDIYAVLIAEDDVNTCSNETKSDHTAAMNSTPLKITGSVIANTMSPNRTYGAATGKNSSIPAEIVDYDSSLYLWGSPRADATKSGKLLTSYLTELPPRY